MAFLVGALVHRSWELGLSFFVTFSHNGSTVTTAWASLALALALSFEKVLSQKSGLTRQSLVFALLSKQSPPS